MAVSPDELLDPVGVIQAEWFPHPSNDAAERHAALVAILEGYIDDGEKRGASITDVTEQDAFVRAWATHRAATAVYLRLSHNPSSESHEGSHSASRMAEQIKTFRTLAEKYELIASALLPQPDVASRAPLRSETVANTFSW